jgi:hypothetical protein
MRQYVISVIQKRPIVEMGLLKNKFVFVTLMVNRPWQERVCLARVLCEQVWLALWLQLC